MHSMPSMRGMVISMVTTSGSVLLNSSSASSPLPAVPTSCRSSNCCERSMRRRMRFESSTIISLKQRWALPFIAFALPLRMLLTLASSGDRAADRLGGRQQDLEAGEAAGVGAHADPAPERVHAARHDVHADPPAGRKIDRKSTRLNSSHGYISYAVFCLKKKKKYSTTPTHTTTIPLFSPLCTP